VRAQEFRFQFQDEPLASAVEQFKVVTGVDVVYSPDLIVSMRANCTYSGISARIALRCIIGENLLEIRIISERQYALIPASEQTNDSSPNRGTISGFVFDAATGESLYGATISLPDLRAGTTSNEAGYFALPGIPSGRHRVRLSYIGFLVKDTTLFVEARAQILELKPTTLALGRVVIEKSAAGRAELSVIPGLVNVPVRRLEALPASFGGKDVIEVLGWLPGIQRAGEVTGGLLVRGSGPDQVLYLIDGAPVYHPWHAFSLISTFQTETFKDLKFYRGSFPAEFGGRLSAVLDAELRDGRNAEPKLIASINPLNARFLIESAIGPKSSFMLSGRRSYIDKLIGRSHPVSDSNGRRDTLRTGYFFHDWSAKVSFAPQTNNRLSFAYYSGRDDLDLRLPFDLSLDFSSWLKPADLFFEVDQDWGNTLYSVRYQHLVTDRLFVSGTAYNSEYSAHEAAFIHPTQSASVTSTYDVTLTDLGVRIDADYFPSLTHQFRTGLSIVNHRFRSGIDALVKYSPSLSETLSQKGDVRTTEFAAHFQDHWKPFDGLSALVGARLSYFGSGNYLRFSPRFSFQTVFNARWFILRGSASSQVQFLQRVRDRFSFLYDLVSSRWIPSGPTVKPSRSRQFALAGESNPFAWLQVTVEGYVRHGRGVVLPRDEFQSKSGLLGPGIDIATLLGQYTPGNERSYGIEAGADLQMLSWQILLAYTGSRSQNRTPELDETSYRPSRFDIPRSFSAVAQRSLGNWRFSLSTVLRSGYPTTVPVARYIITDPVSGEQSFFFHMPEINNGRLPPYFRLDVGVGYRFHFLDATWSAQIHVYNILNRRNVISRTYDPLREGFRPKDNRGLPLLPLFELEMRL